MMVPHMSAPPESNAPGRSWSCPDASTAAGPLRAGVLTLPPPGREGFLRWGWEENGLEEVTCQVHSDVDKHAQITCDGHSAGEISTEPGLEVLLSTAS